MKANVRSYLGGRDRARFTLATLTALAVTACNDTPVATAPGAGARPVASPPTKAAGSPIGLAEVLIDFTSFGAGQAFAPDFYRGEGIRFPDRQCGAAGCVPWFVGFIQGDAALVGEPGFGGVRATFDQPISKLAIQVAPAGQGTAKYQLRVLSASGQVLAATSVTVTQDTGDPADSGWGYFRIGLANLPRGARAFRLSNEFVRSSFPHIASIPYGVSTITFTRSAERP